MSFEDRITSHLDAERSRVADNAGDAASVLTRGRRRRRIAIGLSAAAAAIVVVGSTALVANTLDSRDPVPPAAVTTTTIGETTTTTTAPETTTTAPRTTTTTRAPGPTTTTMQPDTTVPVTVCAGTEVQPDVALAVDLIAWVESTFPDPGVEVIVDEAWALDGWLLVRAHFDRRYEPALFLRDAAGEWGVVWGGVADAADVIRAVVTSDRPGLPEGLVACPDLSRFLEPSQGAVLPAELLERTAGARSIAAGRASIWIGSGYIPGPDTEGVIYEVHPESGQILTVVDPKQPMNFLEVTEDGTLWMARWGDGALPEALIGTYDTSGELQVASLDGFQVSGMDADEEGAWIVQGTTGWAPVVARVDRTTLEITASYPLGGSFELSDIVAFDGVLWIADATGSVLRVDPEDGTLLGATAVGERVVDIGIAADHTDPGGYAVWVLRLDGTLVVLDSEGNETIRYEIDTEACCLLTDPAAETIWVASRSGTIWLAGPDLPPLQQFQADGTVDAATSAGTSLWLVGESTTRIFLGQ